ncbi:MAG: FecR family protein [Algibacter sp.]
MKFNWYNSIEQELSVNAAKKQFFNTVSSSGKSKRYRWKNLLKYAAILVIVISGTLAYQRVFSNEITIITTFGEQKQVRLLDGSEVWLNASSKLSYNKEYPRTLYLEGEAFFDVEKDKSHPFTVSTSDGIQVRVLGTRFNVKSYLSSTITETKLLTGKVELSSKAHFKNKILMIPNEKTIFYRDKNKIVKSKMEGNENKVVWKEGKIQFKNKIFKEIAMDLKTQFNINIQFENEQIANSKFTGSFDKATPIDEILEILKISKDFNYKLNIKTNAWLIN